MTPEDLRVGIFNLNTRRFSVVASVLIKKLVTRKRNKEFFEQLYADFEKRRVEIKCSTVRKTGVREIGEATFMGCIEDELPSNRLVKFSQWQRSDFDCKIQQIKLDKFDVLCVGLFFEDVFVIFRIDRAKFGEQFEYSPSPDETKVSGGWFHLSPSTMELHLKNHLYKRLTYGELLDFIG
jgi:hypothetical protein